MPVSIHAPARGATRGSYFSLSKIRFRSTLPHGERRCDEIPRYPRCDVSIHAPARGATGFGAAIYISPKGFRSTLPHGERPRLRVRLGGSTAFRSTLPHGERPFVTAIMITAFCVSIHAPARGATIELRSTYIPSPVSIHAPARGATSTVAGYHLFRKFRSTLPHGERPSLATAKSKSFCFDPRSRTGSDEGVKVLCFKADWFRSTLPHGERPHTFEAAAAETAFRSTLPHGERLARLPLMPMPCAFRSTLPHGERLIIDVHDVDRCVFRSTLPHGERRPAALHLARIEPVSIHAPARGATACNRQGHTRDLVSIHAPARGATVCGGLRNAHVIKFRSTLPHGERLVPLESVSHPA